MSNEEHYFENLLFYGNDGKYEFNKRSLSLEVQSAIEICAQYVLYTTFCGREDFLKHERPEEYDGVFTIDELKSWLYEIAGNNINNYLGNGCEEIISRLDGFKRFVKERREREWIR